MEKKKPIKNEQKLQFASLLSYYVAMLITRHVSHTTMKVFSFGVPPVLPLILTKNGRENLMKNFGWATTAGIYIINTQI